MNGFMWNPAEKLSMTEEQRKTLKAWVASQDQSPENRAACTHLPVGCGGFAQQVHCPNLKTSRPTVVQWRKRFEEQGPQGLAEDAPHGLSSRALPAEKVKAIVEATLHTTPPDATHWSTRTMAEAMGVSNATVCSDLGCAWIATPSGEAFKFSKDKRFVEKLTDVVGVYLNPPDKAVVLCVDEKSQVQALDRTQPGLPMKKGRCGTMTHDYKRNGTTCLFAALNVLEGTVIGCCYPRHRNKEFLKFLRQIDRETPKGIGHPYDPGQLWYPQSHQVRHGSKSIRAFTAISRQPLPRG